MKTKRARRMRLIGVTGDELFCIVRAVLDVGTKVRPAYA